jgi:membrane protein
LKLLFRDLRQTYSRYREHDGTRNAASIAFFVLFSAVPSVALLILSISWAVEDSHEQAHVLGHVLEILPLGSPQNRAFLLDTVRAVEKSSRGLTVLGVLGLAWSTLGMFSAARWGLDRAWGVRGRASFAGVRLRDVAAALGIWLLLLLSALGTAAIHTALGERELPAGGIPGATDAAWATVDWTMPALLSFAAFLFLYWYVPHVSHRLRHVLPAALVATVLFEISKYLFRLYVSVLSSQSPLYSALGGLLGFMLWIYVCSSILLVGAEYAMVYRHRRAGEV